jgi:hypothetical protein
MLHRTQRLLLLIASATILGSVLGITTSAQAAETVVLKYGIFRGSIPVQDLTTFAETGEASKRLSRYLRLAKQDPDQFRHYLTDDVSTDSKTLNLLLSSPAGDVLLNQFSEYIYLPDSRDDQQMLRSALETSAANDGKLNLVEILQNYPNEKVYINVRRVISTSRQFAAIQQRFGGVVNSGLDILRQIESR